jgi:hypothetical protein
LHHVLELKGSRARVLEIANELAQNPCLVWISDATVNLLHDGFAEHLRPRQVMDGDPAELPFVDARRMCPREGRDLIGDREQRVKALLACHVEVRLELSSVKLIRRCLDLDKAHPGAAAARYADQAVGIDPLVTNGERNLNKGLDGTSRGAKRRRDGSAELPNCGHNSEQSRGGSSLLLLGSRNSRSRD